MTPRVAPAAGPVVGRTPAGRTTATFHAGEQALQARAGSLERMADIGPRVIRASMPLQHREFFAQLPFVALGAVDAAGQPWATLLAGAGPGFVRSPQDTQLRIDALPPADDPLAALLRDGAPLGLLGIELSTRRRNRANGRVAGRDARGFTLHVLQSFGNCPKYIQRRERLDDRPASTAPGAPVHAGRLDAEARRIVRGADTFFIATQAPGDGPPAGVDVSHRGGRPGFVRVSADGSTLAWPDYEGNRFFNTLGNLMLEPRAGLVFVDFETGDLLHVAGRAEIVWAGAEVDAMPGAERLLRLRVDEVLRRPGAWPLRWRFVDESPALAGT